MYCESINTFWIWIWIWHTQTTYSVLLTGLLRPNMTFLLTIYTLWSVAYSFIEVSFQCYFSAPLAMKCSFPDKAISNRMTAARQRVHQFDTNHVYPTFPLIPCDLWLNYLMVRCLLFFRLLLQRDLSYIWSCQTSQITECLWQVVW